MKRAIVFLVALCLCPAAIADTVAMRAPMPGRGLVLSLGFPATEVGFWVNGWLGFGVHLRVPASAVGTEIALRRTFAGDPRLGFGLEGMIAFGLDVPLLSPGFVATATASLAVRYFAAAWFAQLAVTAPTAFRLTDPLEARIPILSELWIGGRAQAVWIGAHLAGGVALVPPERPVPAIQVGLAMGLEL
jgi:hypothetical protein